MIRNYRVTLYQTFQGKRVDSIPFMNRVAIRGESEEDVRKYLEEEGIADIIASRPVELHGYSLEIGKIEAPEDVSASRGNK